MNCLKMGRSLCPKRRARYTENKWISQKNQNELYFLQLIDILNDLLLICRYISYLYLIRSELESNQQPFAHQYIYIYIYIYNICNII